MTLGLLLGAPAVLAQTAAGSLINNQARAVLRGEVVVPSNSVSTLVQPLCLPGLTPTGEAAEPTLRSVTAAGADTVVSFQLTNRGNDRFTFNLDWVAAESDWIPESVRFFDDSDANGRLAAGDAEVSSLNLDRRERVALLMLVTAPLAERGRLVLAPRASCVQHGLSAPRQEGPERLPYAALTLRGDNESAVNSSIGVSDTGRVGTSGRRVVEVRIIAGNSGGGDSGEVEIEIPLGEGSCFSVDPSTAGDGVEVQMANRWYPAALVADRPWLANATARAVRLRLAQLAGGEVAELLLLLEIDDEACGDDLPQLGTVTRSDGVETSGSAGFEAVRRRGSELVAATERGSGSLTRSLVVGQTLCFELLARNSGAEADLYTIAFRSDLPRSQQPQLRLFLRDGSGLPLAASFPLDAGEARTFDLCAVAESSVDPFSISVFLRSEATSSAPSVRLSVASVSLAEALSLALVDTRNQGEGAAAGPLAPLSSAAHERTVAAGELITLQLSVGNGLPIPIQGIRARLDVVQALDPDGRAIERPFELVDGSAGVEADPETGVIRWRFTNLAAGFSRSADVTLRMRDDLPDDTRIETVLSLVSDEVSTRSFSEVLTLVSWSSSLFVDVRIDPPNPAPGDLLTVSVNLQNPSPQPLSIEVVHQPPASALLLEEPAPTDAILLGAAQPSRATELALGPRAVTLQASGRQQVSFTTRLPVSPESDYQGSITVSGGSAFGALLETIRIDYWAEADPGILRRDLGYLFGFVYESHNGAPRFDEASEPLAGVRLLLPDGRQAFSNEVGFYAFRDLPVGWWRLQVDPSTLPTNLVRQGSSVSSSAHRVLVDGVTRVDLPVERLRVDAARLRSSTLQFGPLTLIQHQRVDGEVVERSYEVLSSIAIPEVELRWDDPDEARLVVLSLKAHEVQRGVLILPPDAPFRDPEVSWRLE